MPRHMSRSDSTVLLDSPAEQLGAFGGGELWIGEHSDDHDILVLDPAECDPSADVLTLYSLTQHRTRRFPRATAVDRIHVVTDALAHARARQDYAQRMALRDDHQRALQSARAERLDQIREGVIAAHQRFIATLGLEYQGVRRTIADSRGGRASRCHVCEIALDDFVGVTCGICSSVLCSCGACACGKPVRGRKATPKAPSDLESEA